jgi:hypothetical protein
LQPLTTSFFASSTYEAVKAQKWGTRRFAFLSAFVSLQRNKDALGGAIAKLSRLRGGWRELEQLLLAKKSELLNL